MSDADGQEADVKQRLPEPLVDAERAAQAMLGSIRRLGELDPWTWQKVALRVGEELGKRGNGPDNYYRMNPAEWQDWALGQLGKLATEEAERPAPSSAAGSQAPTTSACDSTRADVPPTLDSCQPDGFFDGGGASVASHADAEMGDKSGQEGADKGAEGLLGICKENGAGSSEVARMEAGRGDKTVPQVIPAAALQIELLPAKWKALGAHSPVAIALLLYDLERHLPEVHRVLASLRERLSDKARLDCQAMAGVLMVCPELVAQRERAEKAEAERDALQKELEEAKAAAALQEDWQAHLIRVIEKALVVPKNTAATLPLVVAAVILKLEQGDAAQDALRTLHGKIREEVLWCQTRGHPYMYEAGKRFAALLPAAEGPTS